MWTEEQSERRRGGQRKDGFTQMNGWMNGWLTGCSLCCRGKLKRLMSGKELPHGKATSLAVPGAAGTLVLNSEPENKLTLCSKQVLMCC